MLNDIEKKLLDDIFEMNINNGPAPTLKNYDLLEESNISNAQWSELGHYLLKLRSLEYIDFKDSTLMRGGQQNRKHKNNIIGAHTSEIEIKNPGISYVMKERETMKDKAITFSKNAGKTLFTRIFDGIIGFVAGVIVAWLAGLF